MTRDAFVDDQLLAAAADATLRLHVTEQQHDNAHRVDNHPAELDLTQTLATRTKSGDLEMCEHIRATPSRSLWSPGMDQLCCHPCWLATAIGWPSSCDCCGEDVAEDEGRMMFIVGPITVIATLCPGCGDAPASGAGEALAEATRIVVAGLQQAWDAAR